MVFVAVDIGGTFTDLIAFDAGAGRIHHAKTLTTPRDPVVGVIDCLRKTVLEPSAIATLIHGSTIAINTLIERKGATVGLHRHARHARRVHHRPRQPARGL